jgi:hypothetical protein
MDYGLLICLFGITIIMAILVPPACARCTSGYTGTGAVERAFLILTIVSGILQFVLNLFLATSWNGAPWSEQAALEYGDSAVFIGNVVMAAILSAYGVVGLLCMWLGMVKSSREKEEENTVDSECRDEKAGYTDDTHEYVVAKPRRYMVPGLKIVHSGEDEKVNWERVMGYKD